MSPPRLIIIGAGSRGEAYAQAVVEATSAVVSAVVEPVATKRARFGKKYVWGDADGPSEGQSFADWREFLGWETARRERLASSGESGDVVPPGVDAAFVCVLDEMHRDVVVGLAPLGLHVMCEKPLATTMADCVEMYKAILGGGGSGGGDDGAGGGDDVSSLESRQPKTLFSIGHVLRYSPHNMLLRQLVLRDRVVGDVLSVQHTEPVGWWHFAHSYVRGNWRDHRTSAPTLLTKSCHDVDFLLWLLCSPADPTDPRARPHLPSAVSATGSLLYFRKARKPAAAGDATNCLSCPLGEGTDKKGGCKYSARDIYVGPKFRGLESKTTDGSGSGSVRWPVKIVVPDIEDHPTMESRREALLAALAEDYTSSTPVAEVSARGWYGRCVFESDNNVADDEVVTMTWEDGKNDDDVDGNGGGHGHHAKRAAFHMTAHTQRVCERYTKIYGSDGEMTADSVTITATSYVTGETRTWRPQVEHSDSHGGGDFGLTGQFVDAVDKVKNHDWDVERAQREFIGCTLIEAVRSHALVFAAEEARAKGAEVKWDEYWQREVVASLQ